MAQMMKSAVRDFFIENYNYVTTIGDIFVAMARSDRYQELQKNYMNMAEKNACKCFNTVDDIVKAMLTNKEQDFKYIKDGV